MSKRLLLFCLIFAVFLAALPLPWLMAVPLVRNHVFARLDHQLAGTISADSCSLGWFSGLRCTGLRYLSFDQSLQLEAKELRSSKGLALLVLAPAYLGDIKLKEPVVSLNFAPAEPAAAKELAKKTFPIPLWWNKASFKFQALRAQVRLQHGESSYPLLADAALTTVLENGSLRYTLRARAGSSEEPNLRAEGFINAPPENDQTSKLLSTSTIVLDSSRIAVLPSLPWAPGLLASMDGKVTGSCNLLRNVDGALQLQGALSLHEPVLPPLSVKDAPLKLDKASLLFDVGRQAREHWQFQQIQLDSDLASLDLRGLWQAKKSDLRAKAAIALPLLSEGLRQKLALRPDARLQNGTLSCDMQAVGPASHLPLQLNCKVSDIAASKASSLISWKKPFELSAQGAWHKDGLALHEAKAQGAWFTLEAGPSTEEGDLSLQVTGNISALNKELDKIAQLPLQVQGRMSLKAARKQQTDQAFRLDELDCRITDFAVKNGETELLPAHEFRLQAKGRKTDTDLFSGSVQGSWWPGSFKMELHDARGQGDTRSGRYHIGGSMLLARLQPLIHNFFPALTSLKLAGSLQLDLTARLQGSQHQLSSAQALFDRPIIKAKAKEAVYSFEATRSIVAAGEAAQSLAVLQDSGLPPLEMASNPALLSEQQAVQSFFDLDKQTLNLQPVVFHSDGVQFKGGLRLGQWWQARPHYALHAHGAMDGAILDTLLRAANRMPAGIRLQGPSQIALKAAYPGNPLPEAELAAHLDWAGFEREGRLLFLQRNLNLYARFEAAESKRLSSWDIPQFSVQSPDLWLLGKGFLWDEGHGSGMLALQGQYRKKEESRQAEETENDASKPFQLSVPFR